MSWCFRFELGKKSTNKRCIKLDSPTPIYIHGCGSRLSGLTPGGRVELAPL